MKTVKPYQRLNSAAHIKNSDHGIGDEISIFTGKVIGRGVTISLRVAEVVQSHDIEEFISWFSYEINPILCANFARYLQIVQCKYFLEY